MLRRVLSAGISNRAFFFLIPSRLKLIGECDRGDGLCARILLVSCRDSWSFELEGGMAAGGHELSDATAELESVVVTGAG